MARRSDATGGTPLWTGDEVARLTNGTLLGGSHEWTAGCVGYAPRSVRPGQLVLATNPQTWGRKFDDTSTHMARFARDGAVAVITDTTPATLPDGLAVLKVDDSRRALDTLAAAARARLAGTVICVVGDTARVFGRAALATILGDQGGTQTNGPRTEGARGVALELASTPAHTKFVVLQVRTRSPEFARTAARLARPHLVLVTDVDPPRSESAVDEKAMVLEGLEPGGTVIVSSDLPCCHRFLLDAVERGATRAVTFGAGPHADVRLASATDGELGIEARAVLGGTVVEYVVPAVEPDRVVHMLGVLGALRVLGADPRPAASAAA